MLPQEFFEFTARAQRLLLPEDEHDHLRRALDLPAPNEQSAKSRS